LLRPIRFIMGRIIVHTHGRPREKAYSHLVEIYSSRLEARGVKLIQHSEKLSHDNYIKKLESLSEDSQLILLEESGKTGTSDWFLSLWKKWKLNTSNIHLAIGPVDGFENSVSDKHESLSLSPLTMTYEMAAVVLLEQLYRVSELERGSPYHRE